MKKQFVVAMTSIASIAMIAASCVSTQKNEVRGIAATMDGGAQAPIVQKMESSNDNRTHYFVNYNQAVKSASPWGGFSNNEAASLSSATMKLSAGQVLVDNDLAFEKKLQMIKEAKNELRMVYFIYSDDDSSSKLNAALIQKANSSGKDFKAYLLVDFITNYKNLDTFIALNKLSGGKIKPFFYNFPNAAVFADANYMTLACPKTVKPDSDTCYEDKMRQIQALGSPEQLNQNPTAMSKILLTGIYGKSKTALMIALGLGAQINPADYKSAKAPMTAEDKDAALEFVGLVKDAYFAERGTSETKKLIAKIKLSIAISMYGEQLNEPLNELTGRVPVRSLGKYSGTNGSSNTAVWDHFTDYTHHKLILADKQQFVMGGRNIEDSYHMKYRVGSAGKYIFMDTDFWGKTTKADGAADMADSFDRIIKSSMVASLETVEKNLVYNLILNPKAAEQAVGACMQQGKSGNDLGECIISSVPRDENAILSSAQATMQKGISSFANYEQQQASKKANNQDSGNEFPELSANDLESSTLYYLENTNINKSNGARITGAKTGFEAKYNKNIHAAWYKAMENVCKVSSDTKREMRVIFHSAYLLMPAGMVYNLGQMLNGAFGDCSKVHISFITNSPFTTDLAPINILARYQLSAMFKHYKKLKDTKGENAVPKLDYYEYTPADPASLAALGGKKPGSLHTKTSLIGDDLIIGSANADVRSYYMDTNNAIMIRNAHEMNAKYKAFVKGLIDTGKLVNLSDEFTKVTAETFRKQNREFLVAGATRWKQEKRLEKGYVDNILAYVDEAGTEIFNTNTLLLGANSAFAKDVLGTDADKINQKLNNGAYSLDGKFKPF